MSQKKSLRNRSLIVEEKREHVMKNFQLREREQLKKAVNTYRQEMVIRQHEVEVKKKAELDHSMQSFKQRFDSYSILKS